MVVDEANLGLADNESDENYATPLVNPVNEENDTTNILAPVTTTLEMVKKMTYPGNFEGADEFVYKMPKAEEIFGDEQRRLETL